MTKKLAEAYIKTSHPDMPIYKKAVLFLDRAERKKDRLIASVGLLATVCAILVSALK